MRAKMWMSTCGAAGLLVGLGAGQALADMTRIATVPAGAEVTGISVNDLGELFFNAQHPDGKDELTGDAPAALIGYVADFNIHTYGGGNLAIPGEKDRDRVHVAAGEYVVLGRAGQELGDGQILGGVYDISGELMFISNDVDFNALVPLSSTEAYLYTAWEGSQRKGVSTVSRLMLQRNRGRWEANFEESGLIDLSGIDGGWVLCYGSISPWGTPLMAEEYYFFNTSLWNHPDNHDEDEKQGFAGGNDITFHQPKMMDRYLGKPSNPYRYGYAIEMNNAASKDDVSLVKHYGLGRLSHENVVVVGDGRTVYQSDDDSAKYTDAKYNTNSGGVFFKFVADVKADLSSGTLYAAKLTQDAGSDPREVGFDVAWVELAHGNNAEIGGWIAEYDGITTADYKPGATNYVSDADVINWAEGKKGQDLNGDGTVGTYPDDRPAFLESRKAAAAMGATYEWNKLEGMTASSDTVYLAVSEISETMDRSWGHVDWATGAKDESNHGDIALDKEGCGAIYAGKLDADFNVVRLEPVLVGRSVEGDYRCDVETLSSPDNILALASGALLLAEDAGGRNHPVDMLWLMK